MSSKSNSLIMCTTPLQMLIAERIIALKPKESFDVITITLSDNPKYRNYFKNISLKCTNSFYYVPELGLIGFFKYIKLLQLNKLNKTYSNLYLASIDSRYFQYLVSKNSQANVYTFDDGTGNIIKNDLYYLNSKPPRLKRIIWRALGIKYYMEDIKRKSLIHYTIYENVPNIVNNTYLINLIDKKVELTSTDRIVKFFLGQPLTEISQEFEAFNLDRVLDHLDIDYYFTHPRESKSIVTNFNRIVNSELIFEDFLINYLEKNPNTHVEIYSFLSSASLNLVNISRVSVYFIYHPLLFEIFKEFYSLAEKEFNINMIYTNLHS